MIRSKTYLFSENCLVIAKVDQQILWPPLQPHWMPIFLSIHTLVKKCPWAKHLSRKGGGFSLNFYTFIFN